MTTPTWIYVSSTIVFLVLFAVVYYYVLKPSIIIPVTEVISICPARWKYENKMCVPQYTTNCKPFDPSKKIDKCDIARSCGTEWPGLKCS